MLVHLSTFGCTHSLSVTVFEVTLQAFHAAIYLGVRGVGVFWPKLKQQMFKKHLLF